MGVESIVLKGAEGGDSLLREQLYNDMLRASGVAAQRTTWAQVWVNEIFQGVYLVQEEIDDALVKSRYGDVDGDLYKMNGAVDLTLPSSDPAYYAAATGSQGTWTYKVYEKTQGTGDYSDLVSFLSVLNNATDSEFQTKFSALFDVNTWLRQAVVECFLLARMSLTFRVSCVESVVVNHNR
jgi:spore coat protein CotH